MATPLLAQTHGSVLLKLLFVTTTFAFACLCYYSLAFADGVDMRAINSIAAPPRAHSNINQLVLAHAAKKLPPRSGTNTDIGIDTDATSTVLALEQMPQVVAVTPTREQLPMTESFYTSSFDDDQDMSTTIIFNVFKGEPQALELQLRAAAAQQQLTTDPEVWVTCFGSPRQHEYEQVVTQLRDTEQLLPHIVFTTSNFDHKFHGRFLLAYMATTKYVLIVDDDKMIDATTVYDYIKLMRTTPGVWGNNGHVRAPTFAGYKSWPTVGYDLRVHDMAEQDYLSGMWFLQQTWLEYFVKERPPTWATSEDMHLSHVVRKYLNLNTYGGKVALDTPKLPRKQHAATVGKALELREHVFDHQLGRGNKVANVVAPIRTLVYAETVADIEDLLAKMQRCPGVVVSAADTVHVDDASDHPLLRTGDAADIDTTATVVDDDNELPPWCVAGKTAVVFRGAVEQDVEGLLAAADALCSETACEFVALKPKIRHTFRHFNMREGFGQRGTDIPWQTAASDVLTSLVGVLNNVLPQQFLFPEVDNEQWLEPSDVLTRKKNRLQIYHSTVRLALQIHVNTQSNQKWDNRDLAADPETAYPSDLRVFTWRKSLRAADGADDAPEQDAHARYEDRFEQPLYQEFSFD